MLSELTILVLEFILPQKFLYYGVVVPQVVKKGRTWLDKDTAFLEIAETTREDEGVYTCTASNPLGTASSSAYISLGQYNLLNQPLIIVETKPIEYMLQSIQNINRLWEYHFENFQGYFLILGHLRCKNFIPL